MKGAVPVRAGASARPLNGISESRKEKAMRDSHGLLGRSTVVLGLLVIMLLSPKAMATHLQVEISRSGGTPVSRTGTTLFGYNGFVNHSTMGLISENPYKMKISGSYNPSHGAGSVSGMYSEHWHLGSSTSCGGFTGVSIGPVGGSWNCKSWTTIKKDDRSVTITSGSTYPSTWRYSRVKLPVPAPGALEIAVRTCLDVKTYPNQCSGYARAWASR